MKTCRAFVIAALSAAGILAVLWVGGAVNLLAAEPAESGKSQGAVAETPIVAHSRLGVVEKDKKDRLLAEPLVDNPDQLRRLHPTDPVWINRQRRRVVLVGAVCGQKSPLELFACLANTKEYESVVAIHTQAKVVHAALLAVGLDPGHPVQFGEKPVGGTGPEVAITVRWKDRQGGRHSAAAQQWVRDVHTGKAMAHPWIFVGSRLIRSEDGRGRYEADATGDLICVSNFPDAMLDLPIPSTDNDASLLFEAFTEHIPPRGTPVTLILEPAPAKKKAR